MEPGLTVQGAWTRESMMAELAGAAFMVIHNSTDFDDALVGASSPAAAVVEIHQTSMADDGTMAMAPVAEVPIPAGGDAVLEPGGYHVMLIDLVAPLEVGQQIELSLEFAAAAPQTIAVPVQALGPMDGMDDSDAARRSDDSDDSDDSTIGRLGRCDCGRPAVPAPARPSPPSPSPSSSQALPSPAHKRPRSRS